VLIAPGCGPARTTGSLSLNGTEAQPPAATFSSSAAIETSAASIPQETNGNTFFITLEVDHFVPNRITVPPGATVIWQVSEEYSDHWIICEAIPFRGWLYEWFPFKYTFNEPGIYEYYDGSYPETARGTIIVR